MDVCGADSRVVLVMGTRCAPLDGTHTFGVKAEAIEALIGDVKRAIAQDKALLASIHHHTAAANRSFIEVLKRSAPPVPTRVSKSALPPMEPVYATVVKRISEAGTMIDHGPQSGSRAAEYTQPQINFQRLVERRESAKSVQTYVSHASVTSQRSLPRNESKTAVGVPTRSPTKSLQPPGAKIRSVSPLDVSYVENSAVRPVSTLSQYSLPQHAHESAHKTAIPVPEIKVNTGSSAHPSLFSQNTARTRSMVLPMPVRKTSDTVYTQVETLPRSDSTFTSFTAQFQLMSKEGSPGTSQATVPYAIVDAKATKALSKYAMLECN